MHVMRMNDTKWAKLGYWEQIKWGVIENLWYDTGTKGERNIMNKPKFWLNGVIVVARDNPLTLPQNWSKQQVKTYAGGTWVRNLNKEAEKWIRTVVGPG